jgi:hypothetical protein
MKLQLKCKIMKLLVLPAVMLAFACGTDPVAGPAIKVRINELSSSNQVYQDTAGDKDDWIELFNLDSEPASLKGYYISDDVDTRLIQILPAEAVVPGHGVLLLWADQQPAQGPLHMNFKLSAGGEGVWLSNTQGYLVDSIEFGTIPPNDAGTELTSFGRFPDGTGKFQWCSVSSPEKVNGDHCGGQSL